MTGDDLFHFICNCMSRPAVGKTLHMVCTALASADAANSVIVVCGNHAETLRIAEVARYVAVKTRDLLHVDIDVASIQFVEVSRDPARYLRGTRGVKVFVDHFAFTQPGAAEWFEMAERQA